MEEERRGLKMVVGIAAIAAVLHLLFNSVFQQMGNDLHYWFTGEEPAYSEAGDGRAGFSPAGLLFSVLIELVIAIGSVVILVISGVWDMIQVGIVWLTDVLNIANDNLMGWKASRTGQPVEQVEAVGAKEKAPAGESDAPSFEQVVLHALKDTREGAKSSDKQMARDITRQLNAEIRVMLAKYQKMLQRFKALSSRVEHIEAELGITDIDPLQIKEELAPEVEEEVSEEKPEETPEEADKVEGESNGDE